MSVLADLEPKTRTNLIDLVERAGVNVDAWRSTPRASQNPHYCYNWAFVQPGVVALLNIWHDNLEANGEAIECEGNMLALADEETDSARRKRAIQFDAAVREVWEQDLALRVNLLGKRVNHERKAHAKYRVLDTQPWTVTEYEADGSFRLRRGA